MKINKKALIISLICIFSVIAVLGSFGGTTYAFYAKEKKAMIILPGLFGSGLYNEATGAWVWDPFEDIDLTFNHLMRPDGSLNTNKLAPLLFTKSVLTQLSKITDNDFLGAEDSLFNLMAMNEDGTPAVKEVVRVPWENETRLRYGVASAQKGMYESLEERYGEEYEVQVFNYDFRLDNRYSAELLEKYINDKGYTEVVLVSHSNGGQVAACYLARSQENRDKVSKYLSFNSPYYGSFSAITILENVKGMIAGVKTALENSSFQLLRDLANNIEFIFENQFMKLINMWAVYQLLPSYELLTQEYAEVETAYYLDGQKMNFASQEELWNFYCSRPWAKTESGELRVQLEEWLDYKESLTVLMPDGSRVLSTTLVDTVYFSGMNVEGANKVYFVTNDDETVSLEAVGKTKKGDGTVSLASAVALVNEESRIRYINNVDHYGILTNYKGTAEEEAYNIIDGHIAETRKWYSDMWLGILGKK